MQGYINIMLIILSSPSGCGKTTLGRALKKKDPKILISVSVTTRPKRNNEVDKVDYVFINDDQYKSLIENNELIEYAKVLGHWYGTPKKIIIDSFKKNKDVLLTLISLKFLFFLLL